MARLAELGGGAVLAEPAAAFAHTLRGTGTARELWPYLLGAAALLLPFDVGVRRLALSRRDWARAWAWIAARLLRRLPFLRRREPRPAVEAPSPVERLFEAKSRAGERRPDVVEVEEVEMVAVAPAGRLTERPAVELPPRATDAPSPPSPPPAPSTEGDTLAGRLLKKKQERKDQV
jgi:hypothetical protein